VAAGISPAAVGVSSPVAGISIVAIGVISALTGVTVAGVPHAASTRLARTSKPKRGNNLRIIFFSFERISVCQHEQKHKHSNLIDQAPPIFAFHRIKYLQLIYE
jgi:hypothetical protein